MRCSSWLAGVVLACVALVLTPAPARAQYRNNGLYIEAGADTYEFAPYTLAAFGATELAWRGYKQVTKNGGGPTLPSWVKPCSQWKPYGFPCQNDWFGITDGVYIGGGFQRVLGDLLIDVSESPILRNIVLTNRALLGLSTTLAGGAHWGPVFVLHEEPGLRWNILDEKIRPYVAMNAEIAMIIDPFGLFGRLSTNRAQCARSESAPGDIRYNNEGCQQLPGSNFSLNNLNPVAGAQMASFYATSFPILPALLRPEVGLEYFFMEDISFQIFTSFAVYTPTLPRFWRLPFFGPSARAGANVVFYF